MTTSIEINKILLKRLLSLSDQKTKEEAVDEVIKDYIQKREQLEILDLFGTCEFETNYNYKTQRQAH